MKKRLPITVIIPTMNRPKTLEKTLDSIFVGNCIPNQLIIIDQSQEEDLRQNVEKLTHKYNGIYLFQKKPSLTMARNRGIEEAANDIVVFSDDDIEIYNNTFSDIFEIMQMEDYALIAGLDDNAGHSKTNIGYLLGTKSYKKRTIGHVTKSVLGRYPDIVLGEVLTEWAMGYFFVCRQSIIDQWNIKWDEHLVSYAYAEDLDFSYRYCKKASSLGMKCVLNEKIHVKHMISSEYRIPSKKSTFMYAIHRRYIGKKNECGSNIAIAWCDFWRIIERIIRHEKPIELIKAIKMAKKLEKMDFVGIERIIDGIN